MRALVTDGSYLHTLGIVRYLDKEAIEVSVIGTSKFDVSFHSKCCKKAIIGPNPMNEDSYIRFLKQVVQNESFDILIPVGYQTAEIIAENKNMLEPSVKIELAGYENIKTALSKRESYELAEKLGVPHPKTVYPQTYGEVEEMACDLDYPAVIKGLFESGKTMVDYALSKKDLSIKYYKMCRQNNLREGTLPMIQEYIGNDPCTYGFAALYQKGSCKRIFMHKEIRSYPIGGGSGTRLCSYYDSSLKEYGMRLLNALGWHGVALVEFKRRTSDDTFILMEINPKFWASLDMALRAGVNFPYYLCQIARGDELEYSEEYNRNLRFHFPFSRELEHMREKPTSVPRVILDTLNPKVKSNVSLSDFKPNFIELVFGLASLLPARIRSLLKKMIKVGEDYGEKA